jgi:ribosome recycling factor
MAEAPANEAALFRDAKQRMDSALVSLDEDLSGFRTGRASPHLVDKLQVEYYGTQTALRELAAISTPEARQLLIRPWDPKAIGAIEKAIVASDLGLTPSNDGQVVRLNVPALTEERRQDLIKLVQRRVEEAKVAVRNVRRDLLHHLEAIEHSDDDLHRAKERAQELTDRYVAEADEHGHKKAAEIREV